MKPIIIGAGLAGLTTALAMAPEPVTLISSGPLGASSSSAWAQGGLAAALGPNDSPLLHAEDTLSAGCGLSDPLLVQQITDDGPRVIADLIAHGTLFDRDTDGNLLLGLEGAHSRRRIVHAKGDSTGSIIMTQLIKAARNTPSITILENMTAESLTGDGAITGVVLVRKDENIFIPSDAVVLATGGAGALWQYTTNPLGSWGHGLVLAAKAGAQLADLEFMQFHPTAIDCGRDPMPLASEALRGEGATIIDENGNRVLANLPRGELEPRDVIARTLFAHAAEGHKIFLDLRHLGKILNSKYSAIVALCHENGLDPSLSPIPIRPAAHYHMGGVSTDGDGKSSLEGLWACGEVASTGLHGANRLASNSLLEAASIGHRVAAALKNRAQRLVGIHQPATTPFNKTKIPDADVDTLKLRQLLGTHVGVLRHHDGLLEARRLLTPLAAHSNRALISLMIATAADQRTESRGAQTRLDFPKTSPAWEHRQILTLNDVLKENAAFLTPTPMIA